MAQIKPQKAQMAHNTRSGPEQGLLFIISAASGTGKTTLAERLVQILPNPRMSRSYTSRPARAGERDGGDYNFVSRARLGARGRRARQALG